MVENQKPKIYDWIAEHEKIEVPSQVIPRRAYNESLVAFIDTLGISDLVYDSSYDAEKILTIMGEIRKYVASECDKLQADNKLHYLQIGDGFVIVTGLRLINQMCKILSTVQWRTLIYSKMLIRGALTAGKAIVDEDRFFIGPAIIEAYKLERGNAIFPRIIFVNEIEKCVSRKLITFNYIAEDQDKIKYLDFIRYNFDTGKLTNQSLDHLLTTYGIKNMLKNNYEKLMLDSKSDNKKTAQKYGWLISKFAYHGIKII